MTNRLRDFVTSMDQSLECLENTPCETSCFRFGLGGIHKSTTCVVTTLTNWLIWCDQVRADTLVRHSSKPFVQQKPAQETSERSTLPPRVSASKCWALSAQDGALCPWCIYFYCGHRNRVSPTPCHGRGGWPRPSRSFDWGPCHGYDECCILGTSDSLPLHSFFHSKMLLDVGCHVEIDLQPSTLS